MSFATVTMIKIECNRCGDYLIDEEHGHQLVFADTIEAAGAVTNTVPALDEWCRLGHLHYCYDDPCQDEAREVIRQRASLVPVPVLPGQMDLLSAVTR